MLAAAALLLEAGIALSIGTGTTVAHAPTARIELNCTVATDQQLVGVTVWRANGTAAATDWIGLFVAGQPDHADPLKLATLSDWPTANGASRGTFQILNWRNHLEFRLFTNSTGANRVPLRVTARLDIDDMSAPVRPRVLPSGGPGEYAVTWTSNRSDNHPRLLFGLAPARFARVAPASSAYVRRDELFGQPANGSGFFELGATLTASLGKWGRRAAGRRIYYTVADDDHPQGADWQASFLVPPLPQDGRTVYPFKFLAFGDMGRGSFDNAVSFGEYGPASKLLPALIQKEVSAGALFVHLFGDLSYACGRLSTWDEFVHIASQFARDVPLLVGVGNHEVDAPGSSMWPRFAAPGGGDGGGGGSGNDSGGEGNVVAGTLFPLPPAGYGSDGVPAASISSPWYVYSAGPVTIVVLSSEHDLTTGSPQHSWAKLAFARVDRSVSPWLFVSLHRPTYLDVILPDLLNYSATVWTHLEPLTQQAKVSAFLYGHAHKWERLSAILQNETIARSREAVAPDGTTTHVFDRPAAPIHYIAGSAGANYIENDCRTYSAPPHNWPCVADWPHAGFASCCIPPWSEAEGYAHTVLRITGQCAFFVFFARTRTTLTSASEQASDAVANFLAELLSGLLALLV